MLQCPAVAVGSGVMGLVDDDIIVVVSRQLVVQFLRVQRLHGNEQMIQRLRLVIAHIQLAEIGILQNTGKGIPALLQNFLTMCDEKQPIALPDVLLAETAVIQTGDNGLAGTGGSHHQIAVVSAHLALGQQFIKDFLVNDVKVEVASNPEFLAQGTAVRDTLQAARIIIGTESKEAEAKLMEIYEPFNLPIVSVKRRSAEMIKYASNDFLALKISYMNDIANLCELVGADIQDVAKGMSYDARIGEKFLNAGIGYGGSCSACGFESRVINSFELKDFEVEVLTAESEELFRFSLYLCANDAAAAGGWLISDVSIGGMSPVRWLEEISKADTIPPEFLFCHISYRTQITYDILGGDSKASGEVMFDTDRKELDITLTPLMAAKWVEDNKRDA